MIDGAINCTYDIFECSDADFLKLFPNGTDIEFAEDFVKRVGTVQAKAITQRLWKRRINKKSARGIHGTIFYGLDEKRVFYPTKREEEMINRFIQTRTSTSAKKKRKLTKKKER